MRSAGFPVIRVPCRGTMPPVTRTKDISCCIAQSGKACSIVNVRNRPTIFERLFTGALGVSNRYSRCQKTADDHILRNLG